MSGSIKKGFDGWPSICIEMLLPSQNGFGAAVWDEQRGVKGMCPTGPSPGVHKSTSPCALTATYTGHTPGPAN